jgi:hypothetical protein
MTLTLPDTEKVGKEPAEWPGGPPEWKNSKDTGDKSLAEHVRVQARDGLIPIEAIAVAKEEDLGLID